LGARTDVCGVRIDVGGVGIGIGGVRVVFVQVGHPIHPIHPSSAGRDIISIGAVRQICVRRIDVVGGKVLRRQCLALIRRASGLGWSCYCRLCHRGSSQSDHQG